jgi:Polysaccharide lyase
MKRPPWIFLLASGTLLCAAIALTPLGGDADVLWSADHETGDLSQWDTDQHGGVFDSGTGRTSPTTDVAHSGHYSVRLAISDAQGKTQAARIFRWDTSEQWGKNAYYSAWYYFPRRYRPATWWNIFQFKSEPKGASHSEPVWSVNVGNRRSGQMYFYLWDAVNERSYSQTLADLPEKQWVHLEAYYVRALGPEGRITVWQDGLLLWDIRGVQTTLANNVYWSVNSYTDDIAPSSAVIYVDDAVISSTQRGP